MGRCGAVVVDRYRSFGPVGVTSRAALICAMAAGCQRTAPPVATSPTPTPLQASQCTDAALATLDVPIGSVLRSESLPHPGAVAVVRLHWFPPATDAGKNDEQILIADLSARGFRASAAGNDGPATLVDVACPVGAPIAAVPSAVPTGTMLVSNPVSPSSSPTDAPRPTSARAGKIITYGDVMQIDRRQENGAWSIDRYRTDHDYVRVGSDVCRAPDAAYLDGSGVPREINLFPMEGAGATITGSESLPDGSTVVHWSQPRQNEGDYVQRARQGSYRIDDRGRPIEVNGVRFTYDLPPEPAGAPSCYSHPLPGPR